MITVINTIKLPKPISQEEARGIFSSTAPNYQNIPGLLQKIYMLSEDGGEVGGVYLWRTRQEAEAMYTDAWRTFVKEKYGAEPSVTYFDSPVVVDNQAQKILSNV